MADHLQSPHTEVAVLQACIVTDPDLPEGEKWWTIVHEMSDGRPSSLFGDYECHRVARILESILRRGNRISSHAVRDALEVAESVADDDGALDGTTDQIMRRLSSASIISDRQSLIESVANLVEVAQRRRQVDDLKEIAESLSEGSLSPSESMEKITAVAAMGLSLSSRPKSAKDVFSDVVETLSNGSSWQVTTGIDSLDRSVKWESGQYAIVTGPSYSSSKAFLINSLVNAMDAGAEVLMCTQDMSPTELYAALLSCISSVPLNNVKDFLRSGGSRADFTDEEFETLVQGRGWLEEKSDGLHLLFARDLSGGVGSLPARISSIIDSQTDKTKPVIVFYDSLQHDYSNGGAARGENLFSVTASSSRQAKSISRSLGISFVMLATARTTLSQGEVQFAGIEGSSSISSDADSLIILTPDQSLNEADGSTGMDVEASVTTPYGEPKRSVLWFDSSNLTYTQSLVQDYVNDEMVVSEVDRSSSEGGSRQYKKRGGGSSNDEVGEPDDSYDKGLSDDIPSSGSRGGNGRVSRRELSDD